MLYYLLFFISLIVKLKLVDKLKSPFYLFHDSRKDVGKVL